MKTPFLPAILFAALAMPLPAAAGDVDLPPEFRPSTFDVYVGAFGSATSITSHYENSALAISGNLDGVSYGGGFRAGADYVADGWVAGLVGDWAFGGEADEDDRNGAALDISNIGTLRARAGLAWNDALVYVTGGVAQVEMRGSGNVGTVQDSDSNWSTGWTMGGGLDYALTDSLSLGLEYLYIGIDEASYKFTDSAGTTVAVDQDVEGMHSFRLGFTYAFHI